MSAISRTVLQQMIQSRSSNAKPDSDGDYLLRFKPDEAHGCADLALVGIEGDDEDIFCVRMSTDRYFPIDEWKRILMIVNDFNKEYRWPTAYVSFPESQDEKTVDVQCHYFVSCQGPATQDMLNYWLTCAITGTDELFKRLIVENKIPLR